MSARKSRHLLMQALVRSSALYGAHPQLADIDAELEELGRCSRRSFPLSAPSSD
jgi:hypothetical protein